MNTDFFSESFSTKCSNENMKTDSEIKAGKKTENIASDQGEACTREKYILVYIENCK